MASARTPESEHSMEEDDYLQVIVESETHKAIYLNRSTQMNSSSTETKRLLLQQPPASQAIIASVSSNASRRGSVPPICKLLTKAFGPHIDRHVLETYFRIPKKNWENQPDPAGADGRLSVE